MSKGNIFVLSGPSGVGKNTVYDELCKIDDNIAQTVSVTTRAPRNNERDGVDYYFVSVDCFNEMINNDEFVEYVQYGDNFYGTLKKEINDLVDNGKTVILVIEVRGAENIKRCFPLSKSLFILPPSQEVLVKRIKERGENTEDEIQKRIDIAKNELTYKDFYDFRVINDDLDVCVREIYNIIKNEINKGE